MKRVTWTVIAALVPALAWAVYVFGPRALVTTAIAVLSALATEQTLQLLRRKPVTLSDGSAALCGLLVALALPVHVPWYAPLAASVFGVAVGKQLLGALGWSMWHPALMGRALVMAVWAPLVLANAEWKDPLWYLGAARAGGSGSEGA